MNIMSWIIQKKRALHLALTYGWRALKSEWSKEKTEPSDQAQGADLLEKPSSEAKDVESLGRLAGTRKSDPEIATRLGDEIFERLDFLSLQEFRNLLLDQSDRLPDLHRKPLESGGEAIPQIQYDAYELPDLDAIFPTPPVQTLEFSKEELLEQKDLLEAQLNNFKVRGKVTGIHPGPVITRYEVELAPGEKVNRISALSDDLALALRAKSIRVAPIPGKSLVGVEVPNHKAQIVYIKEILASQEFGDEPDTLKVALGKTILGEPYAIDLTCAPHLLIAGQTGSGKSVCINSIMASLLARKSPEDLRMILIDPKVVELQPYGGIPHLLGSVITNPETAVQALKWAMVKMDERYEKLAQAGVRNIQGFNEKVRVGTIHEDARYSQFEEFGNNKFPRLSRTESKSPEKMPYLLVIIDGLEGIVGYGGDAAEGTLRCLIDRALNVGIHLVLSSTRPSRDIISRLSKANLPARIAFKTVDELNSRIILGVSGAEKLTGRGDMLYFGSSTEEPVRVHGSLLNDDQCWALAHACSDQNVGYPQVTSFNVDEGLFEEWEAQELLDESFFKAVKLVVQLKHVSLSLLQRRLGVGYAKAGRIIDQMERAGIIGGEQGSKPRQVFLDEHDLRRILNSFDAKKGL